MPLAVRTTPYLAQSAPVSTPKLPSRDLARPDQCAVRIVRPTMSIVNRRAFYSSRCHDSAIGCHLPFDRTRGNAWNSRVEAEGRYRSMPSYGHMRLLIMAEALVPGREGGNGGLCQQQGTITRISSYYYIDCLLHPTISNSEEWPAGSSEC